VEFLEKARAGGADISPLELARCYWSMDRYDQARKEFQKALQRKEAPEYYLCLCIEAVDRQAKEQGQASTSPAASDPATAPTTQAATEPHRDRP
jgi:tetratricopeptide (TPR) repeat protein